MPASAVVEHVEATETEYGVDGKLPSIPVLYLDSHVVVVDKPAGLLTHRSAMARERDVAMMRARDTLGRHVYPAHRLDRGTSGALGLAFSPEAARTFQAHFEQGLADKVYLALVRGSFDKHVVCAHPVPKDEGAERVAAETSFKPLVTGELASLVLAYPKTGRFHQIRRHLAHLRFPIANDSNYGTGWFNRAIRERGLLRLGLHALALSVPVHNTSKRVLAPVPNDFWQVLDALEMRHSAQTQLGELGLLSGPFSGPSRT